MKEPSLSSVDDKGEIILYQPDETIRIDVRVENETVWLTQAQMAELFGTDRTSVVKHIGNIYKTNELEENRTCAKISQVRIEGNRKITRNIPIYNLDMIISVGFRVNTKKGILFRQWANSILKEYLYKGYAIKQQIEHLEENVEKHFRKYDYILQNHQQQIDFFVRTSLPPIEGIFFENQIFDAYVFVSQLIKSAKKSIVLIDNYIDESVFTLLDKREISVSVIIYTQRISPQLQLDIDKHNAQYQPIEIKIYKNAHDRFLIIDNDIYHIGASIKDLGKKLFAFSKLTEFKRKEIIERL